MTMLSLEERVSKLEAIVFKNQTEQAIVTENVEYIASTSDIVLYPVWESGKAYEVGDKVIYLGNLYECIQAHTSQDDWTPALVPALWKRDGTPGEEWPDWVQPTGAHDAYAKDDKVSHHEKHWISAVDANIWEPGVYGWTEEEKTDSYTSR